MEIEDISRARPGYVAGPHCRSGTIEICREPSEDRLSGGNQIEEYLPLPDPTATLAQGLSGPLTRVTTSSQYASPIGPRHDVLAACRGSKE